MNREFPEYDRELPTIVGLADQSWHNDACPKLAGNGFVLFCDYKDVKLREFSDGKAWTLCRDNEQLDVILASDDLAEVVTRYLTDLWNRMSDADGRALLGTAYKELVGYDPFEDNPANTGPAVIDLYAGVVAEQQAASDAQPRKADAVKYPATETGRALMNAARIEYPLTPTQALRLVMYILPNRFGMDYDRVMSPDDWKAAWKAIGRAAYPETKAEGAQP